MASRIEILDEVNSMHMLRLRVHFILLCPYLADIIKNVTFYQFAKLGNHKAC